MDNGAGISATFDHPAGITIDKAGNLYVADYVNNMIRKVDPSLNVTTLAGHKVAGFDNGKGILASFTGPLDVAVDNSNNVFVADYVNEVVRKISIDGTVSTFSKVKLTGSSDFNFHFASGVATDKNDNIYVVDQSSYQVKKITPAGAISLIAGSGTRGILDGKGDKAGFYSPFMIAVDKDGNLYVTDKSTVRKIDINGNVTTVAGLSTDGAVDGPVNIASFNNPVGLIVDANGTIYLADTGNNLIRKIAFE
jgi:streptogramin lyase